MKGLRRRAEGRAVTDPTAGQAGRAGRPAARRRRRAARARLGRRRGGRRFRHRTHPACRRAGSRGGRADAAGPASPACAARARCSRTASARSSTPGHTSSGDPPRPLPTPPEGRAVAAQSGKKYHSAPVRRGAPAGPPRTPASACSRRVTGSASDVSVSTATRPFPAGSQPAGRSPTSIMSVATSPSTARSRAVPRRPAVPDRRLGHGRVQAVQVVSTSTTTNSPAATPSSTTSRNSRSCRLRSSLMAVRWASGQSSGTRNRPSDQLREPVRPRGTQRLDRRGAEGLLAGEVVVERALGDVQPLRHVVQADRVVAALAEQLRRHGDDLLHPPAALALDAAPGRRRAHTSILAVIDFSVSY